MLEVLPLAVHALAAQGVPTILHQKCEQYGELLVDAHVTNIIRSRGKGEQLFPERQKGCCVGGREYRPTATLYIFFVYTAQLRTEKMYPFECPKVGGSAVRVALPAIDEYAVARGERMYALPVYKLSRTAQDDEKEIRSKVVALADVRTASFQFADLL